MKEKYRNANKEIAIERVKNGEGIDYVAASIGATPAEVYNWTQSWRRKETIAVTTAMLQEKEREINGLHAQVRELKSLVRDLLSLVKKGDIEGSPGLDGRIRELGIEGGSE